MKDTLTVGFVGCGNMGGALARAVAKSSISPKLLLSDFDEARVLALAEELSATVSTNEKIASEADFIFLGVKPGVLCSVLCEIKNTASANSDAVIVSMAAGISTAKIKDHISNKVIRIMPNTPALIGSGMITYCTEVCHETDSTFRCLMENAGRLDRIDEKLIDAASAVAGCGPAFVYMFIEALADGAVKCGLPRDKALLYAAATAEGSAKMIMETGEHPEALKDKVCSPGGSTIEGVRALEDGAFRATALNAVVRSYEKTLQLGKS